MDITIWFKKRVDQCLVFFSHVLAVLDAVSGTG